ncbi:MAG: polyprenyl synthetase family protein [Oscillospiraceae bacterium]|nr:polyprenyl synthetase family protein [Oscillospiraceae bacterium]
MEYPERLRSYSAAVEEYLSGCFTGETLPQATLLRAMRYSLLAGGKRLRPALVLEFCRICGEDWHKALPLAAAVEMLHTYSLIHDDLPCMDNDDYRRGRLTNHKVFGEATAVLAGDALLTEAFSTIASSGADPETISACVGVLASAAGAYGMVGGQVLDMEGEQRTLNAEQVQNVHKLKTGCLISAACRIGVLAAKGTPEQLAAAEQYAAALGLAFQIRDDMLDVLGDEKTLGKAVHADGRKTTFVTLYGVEGSAKKIEEETQKAINALAAFPEPKFLVQLAANLATRNS